MRQSGELVQPNTPAPKAHWSDRWGWLIGVVVVLIWLTASWAAPAAELLLKASASPLMGGRATVTAEFTSNGHQIGSAGAAVWLTWWQPLTACKTWPPRWP